MEQNKIRKHLKKKLSKERYTHTKGVMYTAGCLAMAYESSIEQAMLAGLLHDCAKYLTNSEQVHLCEKNHIPVSIVEYQSPYLLHAKLGAFFAKTEYGVTDPDILHAIEVHTTGMPEMNLLDKILYIADYIEPGRDKAPNLEHIRRLAFQDLDACMKEILQNSIRYLESRRNAIDPATRMTYEYYLDKQDTVKTKAGNEKE